MAFCADQLIASRFLTVIPYGLYSIVQKVVYPLSDRARSIKNTVSVSFVRNDGVWDSKYAKLWRHMGRRRIRIMEKLDESKVNWIVSQKRKGVTTKEIAQVMGISIRWVKKLWSRYRHALGKIEYPAPIGRMTRVL